MSVLGIDDDAVNALVPEPFTYPVNVVAPVPPLLTGRVPVTPVVSGNPVAFVSVADVGVPRTGVTNVGDVARATTVPEPVVVYEVPHAVPVELAIPAPG
jgi:hypothetical protein